VFSNRWSPGAPERAEPNEVGVRTSRFRIRFADTRRVQPVDATELERMIRDGELGDDDLVAIGGQFKRYWEHPRYAAYRPAHISDDASASTAASTAAPPTATGGAATTPSNPPPTREPARPDLSVTPPPPTRDAFDDSGRPSTGARRRGRPERGSDPAGQVISPSQARASVKSASRPRVQQLAEEAEAHRREDKAPRPSAEEALHRSAPHRPKQRTAPAPRVATPRAAHETPAAGTAKPDRPRPSAHTEPAGRPVAEEVPKAAPFRVPSAAPTASEAAGAAHRVHVGAPTPPPPPEPAVADDAADEPTFEYETGDPVATQPARTAEPTPSAMVPPAASGPTDAGAPDSGLDAAPSDASNALPSMRVGDATDAPGRPFSADELAMAPADLRDALLEVPVAEILGLDGPRSRKVVNEAWKRRQKQIEATWPRLTPDTAIRAGRADLLRVLNSTMRVLTVPRELRRWQARERELGRAAVYADLFEFQATTVAERPSTLREANERLAELARDEKLAGARLPKRPRGSTEGLDPAVIAAGFTNEMLEAAGKPRPAPTIGDQRRSAEQKRIRAYAIMILIAAGLVVLSWTNACPVAMSG